ncbi:uncharacterized protein LOC124629737 isoform X2 [Helicoverpa zea]|uniref:uncharacterized protein LOC124629737 isoform X2 n=1 Tax=Helicoverpa zea TaxID=7113 RepID=UPI001F58BDA0|nr:uncharacterized protein LOC124629737 isoform X2 [Helicoverpa zea]
MATEEDIDTLKLYWDHFFKAETGTYEKSTWLDLFLAEFLIRVNDGANPKELIKFCPVSGVVTLVGCELLCGIHRVTSSINTHYSVPLPDAALPHLDARDQPPYTEQKPEEQKVGPTSLFTRINTQSSEQILKKYLLGGVAWRCLVLLKALGVEGLSCCRQLSSVLIWLFGELSGAASDTSVNTKPSPPTPRTPIHQLFSNRIWSKQKPIGGQTSKVHSAASSERGSVTGRSRHSTLPKLDSLERTKKRLSKHTDQSSESADSNDDLQILNRSLTIKVCTPNDDFEYFNSTKSSNEYPNDSYYDPFYTPRKAKPKADDYMNDKHREIINSEITTFQFTLIITDLLQELCKAESSLSGSEGSQISMQCINFSLRNLCSLQFTSLPQSQQDNTQEVSRIKVALTELLMVSLDQVLIHSDLCAKLINNGILPMLLRILEDVISKCRQNKLEYQNRKEDKTESENLLKFVFGIAYSITAFFHCLLMQCRSVDKLREFTDQFKLYGECQKGGLLKDCMELMIRIPAEEEEVVVLIKKLIETVGKLIVGMKRVRAEVVHGAACTRARHKACRARVARGLHHHHAALGAARAALPPQPACCVALLYATLSALLADDELAAHALLRHKVLKVMLSCGVCCCLEPALLMETVVRLMLTHGSVASLCLRVLEHTVYGELGASILIPKVTDQLPCSICEPSEDKREVNKKLCSHGISPIERKSVWSFLYHYNSLLQLDNHSNVLHATVSHLLRVTPKCRMEMKYELLFSVIYPTFIVAKHRYIIRMEESAYFLTVSCLNIFASLLNTVSFAEQFIQKGGLSYVLELVSLSEFSNQCCSILEIAIIVEVFKLMKENSDMTYYREMSTLASVQMLFKSLAEMTDKCYKIYRLKLPGEKFAELCDVSKERDMLAFIHPAELRATQHSAPQSINTTYACSENVVEQTIEDHIEIVKNVCTFWRSCANLCLYSPMFRQYVTGEAAFLDSYALLKLLLHYLCHCDCSPQEMRILIKITEALLTVQLSASDVTSGRSKETSCALVRAALCAGGAAEGGAGLRALCEALIRVAAARPSRVHVMPRIAHAKVPPLLCASGSSSAECSSSEDSVAGPYASEHSEPYSSRPDEGYEADVEVGKLDVPPLYRTRKLSGSMSTISSGMSLPTGELSAECGEYSKSGELAHPELCVIVVDILTQLIDKLVGSKEQGGTNGSSWRLGVGVARAWCGRVGAALARARPMHSPLLARLLAPAPARLLAVKDERLEDLQRSILELIHVLGSQSIEPAELAAFLKLFTAENPPLSMLLGALHRLVSTATYNTPDCILTFPVDTDNTDGIQSLAEELSYLVVNTTTSQSHHAENLAKKFHESHLRAGIKSCWSCHAVRVGVEGAGWAPWLAGFALVLWLHRQHATPDADHWDGTDEFNDESSDTEAKQKKSPKKEASSKPTELSHIVSVGHESLMLDTWLDTNTGTFTFRLTRPEVGLNRIVSEARVTTDMPARQWTCVALNVKELVYKRHIYVQVTLYVNGYECEVVTLPVQGILVRKVTPTVVLLGHACPGGTGAGAYHLAGASLYRSAVLTQYTALHLTAHGPDHACQVRCESPNYPLILTPNVLDSNIDWDQVFEISTTTLRELHDNLLLTFSASAPNIMNLYHQTVALPTVFAGRVASSAGLMSASASGAASGGAGSSIPETLFTTWTAAPVASRHRGLTPAIYMLGGPDVLLYLYARVVELEGSAAEQATALGILLRACRVDNRLHSMLYSDAAPDMLLTVLAAPACRVSHHLLKVILDEACSSPLLTICGDSVQLAARTDAVLLQPELLVLLANAWRHLDTEEELTWETEQNGGRVTVRGSAWALALCCVRALLRDEHPRRAFNHTQMCRRALLDHLLRACKVLLLYIRAVLHCTRAAPSTTRRCAAARCSTICCAPARYCYCTYALCCTAPAPRRATTRRCAAARCSTICCAPARYCYCTYALCCTAPAPRRATTRRCAAARCSTICCAPARYCYCTYALCCTAPAPRLQPHADVPPRAARPSAARLQGTATVHTRCAALHPRRAAQPHADVPPRAARPSAARLQGTATVHTRCAALHPRRAFNHTQMCRRALLDHLLRACKVLLLYIRAVLHCTRAAPSTTRRCAAARCSTICCAPARYCYCTYALCCTAPAPRLQPHADVPPRAARPSAARLQGTATVHTRCAALHPRRAAQPHADVPPRAARPSAARLQGTATVHTRCAALHPRRAAQPHADVPPRAARPSAARLQGTATVHTRCAALHPRRAFNHTQMCRRALLDHLLRACKERFLNSECGPLDAVGSAALVDVVRGLVGAPPLLCRLAALADFLLLMHQASDTFVTHSRANFYFLLTSETQEMSEFASSSTKRRPSKRVRKRDENRPSVSSTSTDDVSNDNSLSSLKDKAQSRELDDRIDSSCGSTESTKQLKSKINSQIKEGRKHTVSSTSENSDTPAESSGTTEREGSAADEGTQPENKEPAPEALTDYIVVDADDVNHTTVEMYTSGIYHQRRVRAGAASGWSACEGLLLLLRHALALLPDHEHQQAACGAVCASTLVVLCNQRGARARAAAVRALAALTRRAAPDAARRLLQQHYYIHLANQISLYEGSWELASACAALLTKCDVPLEDQLDDDIWTDVSEEALQRSPALLALLPCCLADVPLAHNITLLARRIIDKASLKVLNEIALVEVVVRSIRAVGEMPDTTFEGRDLLLEDLFELLNRVAIKALSSQHSMQTISELHHLLTYAEWSGGAGAAAAARAAQRALFLAQLDHLEERLHASYATTNRHNYFTTVLSSAVSLGGEGAARAERGELAARLLATVSRAVSFLLAHSPREPLDDDAQLFDRLLSTMLLAVSGSNASRPKWWVSSSADWATPLQELFWWAASPAPGAWALQAALLRALYHAPAPVLHVLTPSDPAHLRKLAVYLLTILKHIHAEAESGTAPVELAITDWARAWAVGTQAGLSERVPSAALAPEAAALLRQDEERWARLAHRTRSVIAKVVWSKESLASKVSDSAMAVTRGVVDAQNAQRKAFMEHLRRAHAAQAAASQAWQRLIDTYTHEQAVWHMPRSYPQSWQLDATEGPGRVRVRLRRAHLHVPDKFLKPQHRHKAEARNMAGPLRSVVGSWGALRGGLVARLQLHETVAYMARATRLTAAAELDGELLLSDRSVHFVPDPAPAAPPRRTHSLVVPEVQAAPQASRWPLAHIMQVSTRRWCLQERAVELFLSSGQAHLLAFADTAERAAFLKALAATQHPPARIEPDTLQDAMTQWRNGSITNWEYLMRLNGLGGRSYNDLMQYPVLPFVLADYSSRILDLNDPASFRDLAKPMAVQNKTREQHYINIYNDLKAARREGCSPLLSRQPHHYASLYSNSGGVLHYLVRVPPFTELFLNYQDNNFDMPDRTFHSLATTWRLITNDSPTDVKELIPELFYLPELFHNNEGLNLGTRQCGAAVDDVELPPWAGDARLFTLIHRQALEAAYVTEHLPHWIDLVFGYKQTGQPALDAINVFPACTYYGFDPTALEEEVDRTAAAAMVRTYGQAPRQLLRAPHPHAAPDLHHASDQVSTCGQAPRQLLRAPHPHAAPDLHHASDQVSTCGQAPRQLLRAPHPHAAPDLHHASDQVSTCGQAPRQLLRAPHPHAAPDLHHASDQVSTCGQAPRQLLRAPHPHAAPDLHHASDQVSTCGQAPRQLLRAPHPHAAPDLHHASDQVSTCGQAPRQLLRAPHPHAAPDLHHASDQVSTCGQAPRQLLRAPHPHAAPDLHHASDQVSTCGQAPRQLLRAPHPHAAPDLHHASDQVSTCGQAPRQLLRAPHPHAAPDLHHASDQVPVWAGVVGARWGRWCGSPELQPPTVVWRRTCAGAASLYALPHARSVAVASRATALIALHDEAANNAQNNGQQPLALVSWGHSDNIVRLKRRRDVRPDLLFHVCALDQITKVVSICATGGCPYPLVVGYASGRVSCVRVRSTAAGARAAARGLHAHAAAAAGLHACARAGLLVSASVDGHIVLWDLHTLSYIRTLPNRDMLSVTHVTISETLCDIASVHDMTSSNANSDGNGDVTPDANDVSDNHTEAYEKDAAYKYKSLIRVHTVNARFVGSVKVCERVTCICYSNAPEGISVNAIAAGLATGAVRLYSSWDLRALRLIPAPDTRAPLLSITFSSDSQLLFGCYAGGVVVAWESAGATRPAPVRIVPAHALF